MNNINNITEKEREHPHCHLIQFLCFVTFFSVWIIDIFIVTPYTGLFFPIPFPVRLLVFGSLICVSFVISRSLHDLLLADDPNIEQNGHKHHLPDRVIDYGVMAYVRHPLYLAMLLFYFAFVFLTMSAIPLIFWATIVLIYNRMASFEEKQLLRMFNEEYSEYQENVPKWLPHPLKLIGR